MFQLWVPKKIPTTFLSTLIYTIKICKTEVCLKVWISTDDHGPFGIFIPSYYCMKSFIFCLNSIFKQLKILIWSEKWIIPTLCLAIWVQEMLPPGEKLWQCSIIPKINWVSKTSTEVLKIREIQVTFLLNSIKISIKKVISIITQRFCHIS